MLSMYRLARSSCLFNSTSISPCHTNSMIVSEKPNNYPMSFTRIAQWQINRRPTIPYRWLLAGVVGEIAEVVKLVAVLLFLLLLTAGISAEGVFSISIFSVLVAIVLLLSTGVSSTSICSLLSVLLRGEILLTAWLMFARIFSAISGQSQIL